MSTVLFGVLSSVCACVRVCVREKLVSSVGAHVRYDVYVPFVYSLRY